MMKNLKLKKYVKNEKGFSLIELMVVVAIMGILAAAIVPQFGGAEDTAKIGVAKADLKNIQSALVLYKLNNGLPADDAAAWTALGGAGYFSSTTAPDDPWGNPYVYAKGTDDFTVTSFGPDKASGGGDDLAIKASGGVYTVTGS